ncbi:hypothetical protein CR513_08243, partial [Mucuna pruriens]
MTEEMQALKSNKKMGHRDPTRRKYISRIKMARLAGHNFTQTYGVNYQETFAHVAKLNTVRVLLSLTVNFDWSLQQYDFKNAILHDNLSEEIYISMSHGYNFSSD